MTEVLRLRPPINAVTRAQAQDDVHNGYTIQKDAFVIINFWGILHDKAVYPEPLAFKPERWPSKEGKLRDENVFPLVAVCGFGRRICPGRYLAQQLVFTAMVQILVLFRTSHARARDGTAVVPPGD